MDEAARPGAERQRAGEPRVGGQRRVGERLEHVGGARLRHREGAVDGAAHLVVGLREVDVDLLAPHGDGDDDRRRLLRVAVVLEVVGEGAGAVGERGDGGAGASFRVVDERAAGTVEAGLTPLVDKLEDAAGAEAVGGDLRQEVAAGLGHA